MSSRDSARPPTIAYSRQSRRRRRSSPWTLDPDVVSTVDPGGDTANSTVVIPPTEAPENPPLIDVDSFVDDDVIVSSPRSFAEAGRKSRRPIFYDVDTEEQVCIIINPNPKSKRPRSNNSSVNCGFYINLEGGSATRKDKSKKPPTVSLKRPVFSCPICMGTFVQETSTKCGHIFCKRCIQAAITAQGKCPTCRKKISTKDTIRIYLPSST